MHKDKDKDKRDRSHRSSRRHDSDEGKDAGSGSESVSETESETDSEGEDDEAIRKAKSMIQSITEDDYFAKSTEFRLWLRQSKKKYFEDLSSDDARRYFKKFVRAWNDFELDESYYKGIRSSQLSSKETTKYQWAFAKKIGRDDQNRVESIRDSIDTMTNVRFAEEVNRLTGKATALGSSGASAAKRVLGPSMPPPSGSQSSTRRPMTADEVMEQEEQDQYRRRQKRAELNSYRKTKDAVLEELAPKETGREAKLEKKRAMNEYHRRERSPDVELSEQDMMGTGSDYKSALAAERRRREARESRRRGDVGPEPSSEGQPSSNQASASSTILAAKQQAYKEKEEKQLEAFRQLWAQTQASKGT